MMCSGKRTAGLLKSQGCRWRRAESGEVGVPGHSQCSRLRSTTESGKAQLIHNGTNPHSPAPVSKSSHISAVISRICSTHDERATFGSFSKIAKIHSLLTTFGGTSESPGSVLPPSPPAVTNPAFSLRLRDPLSALRP
jgi:hypothetical protein